MSPPFPAGRTDDRFFHLSTCGISVAFLCLHLLSLFRGVACNRGPQDHAYAHLGYHEDYLQGKRANPPYNLCPMSRFKTLYECVTSSVTSSSLFCHYYHCASLMILFRLAWRTQTIFSNHSCKSSSPFSLSSRNDRWSISSLKERSQK